MQWSSVVLFDTRGWVLLQERDEHAKIEPEQWSLCGGGLEAGESPLEAAHRELTEETTIVAAPGSLTPMGTYDPSFPGHHSDDQIHVFMAATELTDADIECHEGRQIRFVDPARFADLPITGFATRVIENLMSSTTYAMITR